MNDVTAGQTSIKASDSVLSEVFSTYSDRLTRWVFNHLDRRDWQLAEDIASETFLRLVRDFSGRSIDMGRVYGLLVTIARRATVDHYRLRRSTESATDFGDWFNARQLPVSPAAEDHAIAHLTVLAMVADSASPLGVAA
jgi:DNA-directed RNA polymerase specialized sigma24 family protein